MIGRLTYIDVLMYLLPGAWVLFAVMSAGWSLSPWVTVPVEGSLLDSVLFVLLAFVLGNAVQAAAEGAPQGRLKKEYWKGHFPSVYLFIASAGERGTIVDDVIRQSALDYARRRGWLTPKDQEALQSGTDDEGNRTTSQRLFDQLRVSLERHDTVGRIRGAEGYYLFFRGMSLSAFWAVLIDLIPVASWCVAGLFKLESVESLDHTRLLLLGAAALVNLALWRLFRSRARGAALGLCREVARAAAISSRGLDG